MARHALGVLGVIAAGILLAVSAAMNYRFGFSLGKTAWDGQIYGSASVAADCFKALVPFFFFAALRNRMWSQALAAALVWVVVTGYAMTSALGHAALNRLDTSGQRAAAAANYTDLRADAKRAQDQLAWIPAHRPAETVAAELNVHKAQRYWAVTAECTDVKGKAARDYCQQFHKLNAELASARTSQKLESRIADIGAKLAKTTGTTVMAQADPQASVLAKLSGFDVETVQTALTVFVALLIEIGSAFGMYVAFAYWRLHDRVVPSAANAAAVARAAVWSDEAATPADAAENAVHPPPLRPFSANDNRGKLIPPESDVELFYKCDVDKEAPLGSWVSATDLYEAYRGWAKRNQKRNLSMPRFMEEFDAFGVRKEEILNGIKYFGIALRYAIEKEELKPRVRRARSPGAGKLERQDKGKVSARMQAA